MPGTTPIVDKPDVYTAKAIHERFLSAPGLRLIPDGGVVRQTILKAMNDGKLVVCLSDGRAYDSRGCVTGAEGSRHRAAGTLTSVSLEEDVLISRVDSPFGKRWVKEDPLSEEKGSPGVGGGYGPPPPPPPNITQVIAVNWDQAIEYATDRPVLDLRLVAHTPADAAKLATVAQPLGAERLHLSVSASGNLKDGGTMNFVANNLKPSHPVKPLTIAQTIFNAAGEGTSYEAALELQFGAAGRAGMKASLQQAAQDAPDGIRIQATFDKPPKGAA